MKLFASFVAVVAGLTACAGGSEETRGPVSRIMEGLGGDAAPVTPTDRECLRQRLRANPMLADELRQAGDLDDLDAVSQSRAYEALGPCVPTALGRAVLVAFIEATDGSEPEFVSDSQADCISQHPQAAQWVVDMRYAQEDVDLTDTELTAIVSNVYLCARDVVVNGPLARSLEIEPQAAACVARQLETRLNMVPEVAQLMFGQSEEQPSRALAQLISGCTG